jgi:hypothetical protein
MLDGWVRRRIDPRLNRIGHILFFMALMLAPGFFPVLAYAFAGLTFMSALGRVGLAWTAFRDENGETD